MSDWPVLRHGYQGAVTVMTDELASVGLITSSADTNTAWPTANKALYIPIRITHPCVALRMLVLNGATASGNMDVGIYDYAGTRLVSSGSTAQSGTSAFQDFDITDTLLGPGIFYLALALDNTTGTIGMHTVFPRYLRAAGVQEQGTAFALPATATFATASVQVLPRMGLTVRNLL